MHMHATPILCLLHTWWQGHAHACSEYFSYLPRRRGTKWLACMCIPRVPHENIHGACTCMHTVITWAWTNSCNKYNPFYRIFIGYACAYPVVCMCILCVLFLECTIKKSSCGPTAINELESIRSRAVALRRPRGPLTTPVRRPRSPNPAGRRA